MPNAASSPATAPHAQTVCASKAPLKAFLSARQLCPNVDRPLRKLHPCRHGRVCAQCDNDLARPCRRRAEGQARRLWILKLRSRGELRREVETLDRWQPQQKTFFWALEIWELRSGARSHAG